MSPGPNAMAPQPAVSTYRLQLSGAFRLADALAAVPYLDSLGVAALYVSPISTAAPGSGHGYDVCDPTSINPELGSEEDLRALSEALAARGMGLLLDIVPNHMAASTANRWWRNVLADGPDSPDAPVFDVDWRPTGATGRGQVLLPVLGDRYGLVIGRGEIRLVLEEDEPAVAYHDRRFPMAVHSWPGVLETAAEPLSPDAAGLLRAIAGDIRAAQAGTGSRRFVDPATGALLRERLAQLMTERPEVRDALAAALEAERDPDRLHELLEQQAYRVADWRIASERVNYRRFFDVADLISVRVEDPSVFERTHGLILRLVAEGLVSGLRIDHIDGLWDPIDYLERLQAAVTAAGGGPTWVVVEKILSGDEELPPEWPVAGTTGYEFGRAVASALLDPGGLAALDELYYRFTGRPERFADLLYRQKSHVLAELFAGEMERRSQELFRLAELDRYARDLSRRQLGEAFAAVTVAFHAYRTYARDMRQNRIDRERIEQAVAEAARRRPDLDPDAFALVRRVLLFETAPGGGATEAPWERDRAWLEMVMRWQQLTGPLMAKGQEDTALYQYNRLLSLNMVGGEPDPPRESLGAAGFHRHAAAQVERWWGGLMATSTHDSKRSEDVRGRLHVLAEIPDAWQRALWRWHRFNQPHRAQVGEGMAPDANEELFLYQTLVGVWPLDPSEESRFRERLERYLVKAAREAKVHTSWTKVDEAYEAALVGFAAAILDPARSPEFLADFRRMIERVALHGAVNDLAQLALKLGAPGVADFYQGTELWTLTMVDPDNRDPVDLAARARLLADLDAREARGRAGLCAALCRDWRSGEIKAYVTSRGLRARREHAALFQRGEYIPLETAGVRAEHLLAFARRLDGEWLVCAVPRLPATIASGLPLGARAWRDTSVRLPGGAPASWRDLLSGASITAGDSLGAAALFRHLPVALLHARDS
ncbi:MAG TPA: malto-oligosyltrehalose synthase [Kofleriaceae bacterium]|nr:malto-oligosyltrehalose synthase [Kofleriaceae bacterium]